MTMARGEQIARVLAVIAGTAILSLVVIGPTTWWGVVGSVPIVVGLSGW